MQRSWGRAVPTCTRDGKEASMAGLSDRDMAGYWI